MISFKTRLISCHCRRRRRKRHASQSIANNNSNPIGLGGHPNVPDDAKNTDDLSNGLASLRVATKTEWKRLRNVYLTLQRKKYSEIKKLLQQNRQSDSHKVSSLPLSTVRPVTMKSKPIPPPAKRICTRNINFYGANRDEHNTNTYECSIIDEKKTEHDTAKDTGKTQKKTLSKDVQFEYEPGLIVKVNFDEPCTDTADFKAEMRQYGFVKYIDVKEGQTHAFVRVDASRSAPVLIKHCAPNRCQILTGENETEYWAKIAKDREQKLSKAIKVPRDRSRKMRNIIKNIAEINVVKTENKTTVNHIRFDDD